MWKLTSGCQMYGKNQPSDTFKIRPLKDLKYSELLVRTWNNWNMEHDWNLLDQKAIGQIQRDSHSVKSCLTVELCAVLWLPGSYFVADCVSTRSQRHLSFQLSQLPLLVASYESQAHYCVALWCSGERIGLLVTLLRRDSKVVGLNPPRVDFSAADDKPGFSMEYEKWLDICIYRLNQYINIKVNTY